MKFFYRLSYYIAGLSVGLVILVFIFSGKKTSCNYSPSSRVKNDLLQKQIKLSPDLQNQFYELNDSVLRYYINHGEINFSKSKTKLDSCRIYHIELKESIYIEAANCLKYVEIIRLQIQ